MLLKQGPLDQPLSSMLPQPLLDRASGLPAPREVPFGLRIRLRRKLLQCPNDDPSLGDKLAASVPLGFPVGPQQFP